MRMTHGWSPMRRWALAAALTWGALGAGVAQAGPMSNDSPNVVETPTNTPFTYGTSGSIGTNGVSGAGVIGFNSLDVALNTEFVTPSSFSLGEFLVAPLPDSNTTTTYTNTDFSITLLPKDMAPIVLNGVLNGTVRGANQTDVVASFNATNPITWVTGNTQFTLDIADTTLSLVPSTTLGGRTTAQAKLQSTLLATPVPEPASLAVFASAAVVGLFLRRRMRS